MFTSQKTRRVNSLRDEMKGNYVRQLQLAVMVCFSNLGSH